MVSKGLAGAAALAFTLATAGAFAPGRAFVKSPLSPQSYGINKAVDVDGVVAAGAQISKVRETKDPLIARFMSMQYRSTASHVSFDA